MRDLRVESWTAVVLALLVSGPGCGSDEPAPAPGPVPAGTGASAGDGEAAVVDREDPRFAGVDEWETTAWGRVRLGWPAAVDDVTPPHAMVYRVTGAAALSPGLAPAPRTSEAVESLVGPGAISVEVTTPLSHTAWWVEAQDESGRSTGSPQPLLVRTRPLVEDVLQGGLAAPITACRRDHDASLLCLGDDGRLARWRDGIWTEHRLPFSTPVALADSPDRLLLYTISGRFRLDDAHDLLADDDRFDAAPVYPLRRFAIEPSGLSLWLDGSGAIWASDGSSAFQRLDDPLLLGPERACLGLRDLWIEEGRALAWCENGQQFLLRPETHGYRWSELPDGSGLPSEARPRRVLFGEGRRITWLDWSGVVWRYDLGGWRRLWEADEAITAATAIAPSPDERLLWVGAGPAIWAVDALGQRELVVDLPTRSAVVFIEAEEETGSAVTARGQVFAVPDGLPRRDVAPERFVLAVRSETETLRLLVESEPPASLTVDHDADSWALGPDLRWPADLVVNAAIDDPNGGLLLGVDAGVSGGQLLALAADSDPVVLPFVYPPPLEADGEPEPSSEPETGAELVPPPEPAVRLVGVTVDQLAEPPPTEPPVRDVDIHAETGTAVAVGEGGRIWLRVAGGWLPIDVGLTFPVPLLTVRAFGDHAYLVGGVDGLVLRCVWDACESEMAPVGDVLALRYLAESWYALGPGGVARDDGTGTWVSVTPSLEEPAPGGLPPSSWLDLAEGGGQRWWLGTDGSVWLETGRSLRPMGLVEEPLRLYVDGSGRALVASRGGVFRVIPP